MKNVSVKLSNSTYHKMVSIAEKRKITKSDLIRAAIEMILSGQKITTKPTAYDLSADLCGSLKAPKDLSTNKDYLEGFGE